MNEERLQKLISNYGYCSRRKAEELIVNNKVKVNDKIINTLGYKCTLSDKIEVEGNILNKKIENYYLKLNKPEGYLCTNYDSFKRKTIQDLIDSTKYGRVYSIGRLDCNSSGLLLLTNDGEFSNLINHPSSSPEKEYVVKVKPKLKDEDILKIENGLYITHLGYKALPAKVKVLNQDDATTSFSIILNEGKKREIREMMKTLHHKVIKLTRIRIGNILLSSLKEGECVGLSKEEIESLKMMCIIKKEKGKNDK